MWTEHVGDLDRVKKLAKLNIYLAATAQFTDHAAVADGASDLFSQLFSKENGHARMVSGVVGLPKGTPVVVETVFET
jgi:enamine deaminase RidA (YjgF/YER057c/UK114 family)